MACWQAFDLNCSPLRLFLNAGCKINNWDSPANPWSIFKLKLCPMRPTAQKFKHVRLEQVLVHCHCTQSWMSTKISSAHKTARYDVSVFLANMHNNRLYP